MRLLLPRARRPCRPQLGYHCWKACWLGWTCGRGDRPGGGRRDTGGSGWLGRGCAHARARLSNQQTQGHCLRAAAPMLRNRSLAARGSMAAPARPCARPRRQVQPGSRGWQGGSPQLADDLIKARPIGRLLGPAALQQRHVGGILALRQLRGAAGRLRGALGPRALADRRQRAPCQSGAPACSLWLSARVPRSSRCRVGSEAVL